MVKYKVFVSFDYSSDFSLKQNLIAQANDPSSLFEIVDFSIQKQLPQGQWLRQAQSAIARYDVFLVLLGMNTHQAPGVLKEVAIAKGLKKRRYQLKPQGWKPKSIEGAGQVRNWTHKKLQQMLSD